MTDYLSAPRARRNLLMSAELLRLVSQFSQDDVAAIPFKGPVLAEWAYGDIAARDFCDLDVLVRPWDVARAHDVLLTSGYVLRSNLHCETAAGLRSKECELIYARHDGINVDLHWRLLPRYFPQLDEDRIWSNLVEMQLCGQSVRTLAPDDLILYLSAHGGKHRWEQIRYVRDLAMAWKRAGARYEDILIRARAAHMEQMLVTGLRLASDLFGLGIRELTCASPEISCLAHELRHRLERTGETEPSALDACRTNLRLLDRPWDRLRFLHGILLAPGEAEWQQLRLPPRLYPLYYPYRLMRLAAKYTG